MHPQPQIQLSDVRIGLPQRYGPYWNALSVARHLGYQKRGAVAYWVARYRTTGNSYRQKRLGVADDHRIADGVTILSHDQALDRAREWFDGNENRDASPDVRVETTRELVFCAVGSEFTIGHAIQDFVEWKRLAATADHFSTMMSIINRYIVPNLANVRVGDFSREMIHRFTRTVLETAPKYGSRRPGPSVAVEKLDAEALRKRKKLANTLLGHVRTALRMAWENEKIENDRVWRRIGRFRRVDRPRMLHLSRVECRRLVEACRSDLRDLVLGALYTGCRVVELCNMRCSHVGHDGYGIYIAPSKSHRARFVFLPDEGMAWFLALTNRRSADDCVFKTRIGRRWRAGAYTWLFREAVKLAKIPEEFSFHGLRHTYASQLVQAGTSVFAIADQLGHSNPMTVFRTYGHLSPQIRESEVRQRFTVLDAANAQVALRQAKKLERWRGSLHGGDWRTYASISDLASRSNREEGDDRPTVSHLEELESLETVRRITTAR